VTAPALALDAGTRWARAASVDAGTPRLLDLPGFLPGEGLPLPAGAADRGGALRRAYAAYRTRYGTPARVVVVVPQQGRAEHARRAADALTAAHTADQPPPIRVLAVPHAVLALLRHRGEAAPGGYAVCDLGAGAAEVSVCHLAPGAVAVTSCAGHAPDGGYGAVLDAALLSAAGLAADEAGLRALDAARAEEGAGPRLDVALSRALTHPDRYDATTVHTLDGRPVPVGAARQALVRLTAGLDQALAAASDGGPLPRAVAVGGLARFGPLVRHLAVSGPPGLAELPPGVDPASAAVLGAALVAEGLVDPQDRYPHAVWVAAHRTEAGRPLTRELLLSPAGALEPGGETLFAREEGRRTRVRTGPPGTSAQRPVQVRVRDADGSRTAQVGALTLPDAAEGDRFHVGVRLAVDGTARLVLEPLGAGPPGEFPLGRLPLDLPDTRPADRTAPTAPTVPSVPSDPSDPNDRTAPNDGPTDKEVRT
jgi:hypothetical protein